MKATPPRILVGITVWNRAERLAALLGSLASAHRVEDFDIIIARQGDDPGVTKVLERFGALITEVIQVPMSPQLGPLFNINTNRIALCEYAFEQGDFDGLLAFEDDVVLGWDALHFAQSMLQRYRELPDFRGVNLGSREPKTAQSLRTYSLLRYGLHGQGALMTRATWNAIRPTIQASGLTFEGFDSLIEAYVKTGFMVTPNASRYIDTGWGGTHMPNDPSADYFAELRVSWVGESSFDVPDYQLVQMDHAWRGDCISYRRRDWPRYRLALMKARFKRFVARWLDLDR